MIAIFLGGGGDESCLLAESFVQGLRETYAALLLATRALHDDAKGMRALLRVEERVLALRADAAAIEALQADEHAVGSILSSANRR